MKFKNEIHIRWSDEDEAFIAEVVGMPGCMAHGGTYDEAVAAIQEAMKLWVETAREFAELKQEPEGKTLEPV